MTTSDWTKNLTDHPIFHGVLIEPVHGRQQCITLKDTDIILAVGKELRIASLAVSEGPKSYKLLHTPEVDFNIRELVLNPNGKLLAVVGEFQTVVVVMPRPGYARQESVKVDCKIFQVGNYYHNRRNAPIVKVDWHPWGHSNSTLLIMTAEGNLREYDLSNSPSEPTQTVPFIPPVSNGHSFAAMDASEREAVSFTFGSGSSDWGSLTVYALMRSGDIYAICPYLPVNAAVPAAYIQSLSCFVTEKQEYLASTPSTSTASLSTLYDYQHKYISALVKQITPSLASGHTALAQRSQIRPPATIKARPMLQGPFLLQPAPRTIPQSDIGDACDILYSLVIYGEAKEELGIACVAYSDGRVDVLIDVEKVEARWDTRQNTGGGLPMFAVQETINLGLVSMLANSNVDLLASNFPTLHADPLHSDKIYAVHAFGVHGLYFESMLASMATPDSFANSNTRVTSLISTIAPDKQSYNAVLAKLIPNDVYVAYNLFAFTSTMRMVSVPLPLCELPLKDENPLEKIATIAQSSASTVAPPPPISYFIPTSASDPMVHVSLLSTPYTLPSILSSPLPKLPSYPKILGGNCQLLTPESLRHLGAVVTTLLAHIYEMHLQIGEMDQRLHLQSRETINLTGSARGLLGLLDTLKFRANKVTSDRVAVLAAKQTEINKRLDRSLQILVDGASPALSEHESRWFKELGRMREEIVGNGKYDERCLEVRAKNVERELERVLTALSDLSLSHPKLGGTLGTSQAFDFGERSAAMRMSIVEQQREILNLAAQMDALSVIGKPPAQKEFNGSASLSISRGMLR